MSDQETAESKATESEHRVVAVVEVGTTAIRMALAQVDASGNLRALESPQRAVAVGKDAFTEGVIGRQTTEECVRVLRSFRHILREYRVADDQIHAVATSAVREATNRDAFLDRIYIATGITVEAIDEAEVNRYTYLAVQPLIEAEKSLRDRDILVCEVGGGSTEVLMLRGGQVVAAHVYRLGALRLLKMLEDYDAPAKRLLEIMRNRVDRTVRQMKAGLGPATSPVMLAIGGDARFACERLVPGWKRKGLGKLKVSELSALTDELLGLSADEIVRRYHVSFPDAETLGPALLVYTELARALNHRELFVGAATLRDGLLVETASRELWTEPYRQSIINSALEVGRKYGFDETHAEQVARAAQALFDGLCDEHRLPARYRLILTIASLLHDVGGYVSNRNHHDHAMYLILNSDLFGLGPRDLMLTALVARYHRRATPQPSHEHYSELGRDERIVLIKLVALLRLADAVSRRHWDAGANLSIGFEPGRLILTIPGSSDLAIEQYALEEKGPLFEEVYGMDIVLRRRQGRPLHVSK